jgi:hypothetical protein
MDYVTVKLHADTRRLLRLIAAQTGEQMVQVMDRLCREEWAKIEGAAKIGLHTRLHKNRVVALRKRAAYPTRDWWSDGDSNPGPSACKLDVRAFARLYPLPYPSSTRHIRGLRFV